MSNWNFVELHCSLRGVSVFLAATLFIGACHSDDDTPDKVFRIYEIRLNLTELEAIRTDYLPLEGIRTWRIYSELANCPDSADGGPLASKITRLATKDNNRFTATIHPLKRELRERVIDDSGDTRPVWSGTNWPAISSAPYVGFVTNADLFETHVNELLSTEDLKPNDNEAINFSFYPIAQFTAIGDVPTTRFFATMRNLSVSAGPNWQQLPESLREKWSRLITALEQVLRNAQAIHLIVDNDKSQESLVFTFKVVPQPESMLHDELQSFIHRNQAENAARDFILLTEKTEQGNIANLIRMAEECLRSDIAVARIPSAASPQMVEDSQEGKREWRLVKLQGKVLNNLFGDAKSSVVAAVEEEAGKNTELKISLRLSGEAASKSLYYVDRMWVAIELFL